MTKHTIERQDTGEIEQGCIHRVTIGLKMPIPHIDYSNLSVELSCEGPDREFLIEDTKARLYTLLEEMLEDFEATTPVNKKR